MKNDIYKCRITIGNVVFTGKVAQAAVESRSLLAIFPARGRKSITFQLTALMGGNQRMDCGYSPLQSY